jgi:beta-N-acetylhexosaminidase
MPFASLLLFTLFSLACKSSSLPTRTLPQRSEALHRTGPAISTSTWDTPQALDSLISSLSLEEKVAQMMMVRAYGQYVSRDDDSFNHLIGLVKDTKVGGIVIMQGDVYEEAVLLNALQAEARIPLLVASDFERGIAMRVRRGTSFPEAMAVGATRNPEDAYAMGRITAQEARAIGVHEVYAPVADINTNPLNPVINTRSFGDDPGLVGRMAAAFVHGVIDGGAIATVKHFPGHGDTGVDSHVGLPVLPYPRSRLDSVELSSFKSAIAAGTQAVMLGHIAVPALDSSGLPMSLSRRGIEDDLRGDLGFTGLTVTDALGMQGALQGRTSDSAAVLAVRAGIDVLLDPVDIESAVSAIVRNVSSGEIPESRIDASVRRILQAKHTLGLDRHRTVDIDAIAGIVATKAHRQTAKSIARDAITVVRNSGGILPLQPNAQGHMKIVLASDVDDDRTEIDRPESPWPNEPTGNYFLRLLRRRAGGVDVFRVSPSSDESAVLSMPESLKAGDLVLFALFAKVRSTADMPEYLHPLLSRLSETPASVITCILGNPYLAADFPKSDAIVCTYGDEEPVTEAAVESLFGEIPTHGRLPVSIPGVFPFGTGLDLPQTQLRRDDPALAGFNPEALNQVDSVVIAAIRDSAFPGAEVAIVKNQILAYDKTFGKFTYDADSRRVDEETMYDLASVTKVVSTTAAAMKLYDEHRLGLQDSLARYLPQLRGKPKGAITIRQLLLHRGGFPPFRKLYGMGLSPAAAFDTILATPLVAKPGDSTVYSDLSMITLGKVVEAITGSPLDVFVKREFYGPLGMTHTMYNPGEALWPNIAPTELDTVWRKRLVQGTVHDESAAVLGGVSGNAGLFSTASDLAIFVQMLLNKGTYAGRRFLSAETVDEFIATKEPGQERWLGWDMKSGERSSAGKYFSTSSFGHTGFTGTSIWVDPQRNLAVIFLTNRVYPTRADLHILKVRPQLHDAVIRALTSSRSAK